MLASFVGDPEVHRRADGSVVQGIRQLGLLDAMCFNLFDRTPHAWGKVAKWSTGRKEFEKRTAFALLWSLTVHDKGPGMSRSCKASR